MFNIAFPELIVILVVSLIVIGPDKLPKVANTLGVMIGRMQRFMSSIKNDIDQELKNNDLHRLQEELKLQSEGLNDELRKGMQPVSEVIHRPKPTKTSSELPESASEQPIDKSTDQKQSINKSEGIST